MTDEKLARLKEISDEIEKTGIHGMIALRWIISELKEAWNENAKLRAEIAEYREAITGIHLETISDAGDPWTDKDRVGIKNRCERILSRYPEREGEK